MISVILSVSSDDDLFRHIRWLKKEYGCGQEPCGQNNLLSTEFNWGLECDDLDGIKQNQPVYFYFHELSKAVYFKMVCG